MQHDMKPEKDMFEFGKEKMDQARSFFEELEVQLALGKAEAKEVLERERKNFMNFMDEQRSRLRKDEKAKAERLEVLEAKMDALAELLVAEAAGTVEAYDQAKAALLHEIYDVEAALKNAYAEAGASLRQRLDAFRTALDAYRIPLALSSFENQQEALSKKDELNAVLAELLGHFHAEEKNEDKLEHFMTEMETAFEHVKKAVKELIQP